LINGVKIKFENSPFAKCEKKNQKPEPETPVKPTTRKTKSAMSDPDDSDCDVRSKRPSHEVKEAVKEAVKRSRKTPVKATLTSSPAPSTPAPSTLAPTPALSTPLSCPATPSSPATALVVYEPAKAGEDFLQKMQEAAAEFKKDLATVGDQLFERLQQRQLEKDIPPRPSPQHTSFPWGTQQPAMSTGDLFSSAPVASTWQAPYGNIPSNFSPYTVPQFTVPQFTLPQFTLPQFAPAQFAVPQFAPPQFQSPFSFGSPTRTPAPQFPEFSAPLQQQMMEFIMQQQMKKLN
jgi:hypothetical protein